ncbi:hypothetical protein tf_20 [Pseudomonas phage tf]|uniref:Uncharacterized protein n=1 Tax=Pseudomonas phage tf TaxID=1114179 RepID=I2FLP1_9CAUD|nr:hypothetical protein tf_20 [Pseudomonas phage tf]CCE60775.1 hypothetical protein tf_20 [Pseudomonas phage tf]
MKGNKHPLQSSGDFGMYYNGTWVFSYVNGQPHAMYVEGTERVAGGDETQLSGVLLIGNTFNADGDAGYSRWACDRIEDFRPISGYCDFGSGVRNKYVTYNVPNRTQKKGLDQRNILVNNRQTNLRGHQMVMLFTQTLGMVSSPADRDFYITGDNLGVVFWKGVEVGRLVNGALVCNETHKTKEIILCRLLQNS